MAAKKILFVAPLPPPTTGQSIASDALKSDLLRLGYLVEVVNLSKESFKSGSNSIARILQIVSIILNIVKNKKNSQLVYLTVSESVLGNIKDIIVLFFLGKKLRSKTFIHLHGGAGMRELISDRHPVLKKINSWALKDIAGAIVLGERLTSVYSQILPNIKIKIVKNFAPDDSFISKSVFEEKWKKDVEENKTIRLLYLSNLLPGKGYIELLSAIEKLPEKVREKFIFDFAGAFEKDIDKKYFLERISCLQNVIYHGVVHGADKKKLLSSAHVFALPSYYPYEGQPISILEAYAAGCAVITTDHSGIFDIFTPKSNGWEVKPKNVDSIVTVLEEISNDLSCAQNFAEVNFSLASSQYKKASHLSSLRASLGIE